MKLFSYKIQEHRDEGLGTRRGPAETSLDRLRGTTRAEDARGTPDQNHISPSILVYEDNFLKERLQYEGKVNVIFSCSIRR